MACTRPVAAFLGATLWAVILVSAEARAGEALRLPEKLEHPQLACTAEELGRLKAALSGSGPERKPVEAAVKAAERFLATPLAFPPRGGQHNQWYQCEKCQLGLETVDDTHHKCPRCGKVYSGEPFDDVIFARKHSANIRGLADCAWAWALTGRREFAERARAVLLGYAERYTKYPYHDNGCKTGKAASKSGGHINEQTLGEASDLATRIAPAYDLVWNALSDADRTAVRDGLLLPMLRNIDKHKAGKSNWQSWHNAALFAGGLLAGEPDFARRSVADGANGFRSQMRVSVSAEGMWYENSWGYHFYTLAALTAHAEFARRAGVALWAEEPLRKMFRLPVEYTMADGSLPRFGDDAGSRADSRYFLEMLEHAQAATGDARMLALLPAEPNWASVLHGRRPQASATPAARPSTVYKGAGHAILRTSGPAGLSAALTFGPYGGFHGHLDKLSFVLFGHGEELGVDPGRARSQAYRLPIHTGWYKATLGHNAVLVNGKSQEPAEGKLLLFSAKPEYALGAATCDSAYKGVRHARLLCLGPEYLLVLDVLDSKAAARFDWLYHNRGARARCDLAAKEAKRLPFVEDEREGRTDGEVRIVFEGEKIDTHLVMARGAEATVLVGHGPLGSVQERAPLVMVSRQGKSAVFCAVIEPVKKPAAPAVRGIEVAEAAGRLAARITIGGRTDVVTWDRAGAAQLSVGGKPLLP